MAKPLGIVFWGLSVACLCLGFANYVKTVNKYSRRAAIVQTGWKTHSVSFEFWEREREREEVLMVMADFDGCGICYCCRLHTFSDDEFEEVLKKRRRRIGLRS